MDITNAESRYTLPQDHNQVPRSDLPRILDNVLAELNGVFVSILNNI